MASTGLRISIAGQCARSYKEPIFAGNSKSTLANSFRPFQPPPQRPTVLCFSSRRRQRAIPSVSSKTFKKKVRKQNVGEDEDAVDALFRKVEEVLKNGEDDISGEELEKFEQELAEALTDDELFGALESLARGETKNGKKEEEEDDVGEGEDDMSDEELEKLVQELSEFLEDDELFEEMESIVRGESKSDDDDDDDDDKLAKLKRVLKEKEEELAKLEQELVESLAEEDDDDEEELAKLEQEMAEALAQDEEDDDDDEEEEEEEVEEVEVVKVEAEIVEDDDEDNDISEEKLVELVEELSEALKDGEMLINFRVHRN